MSSTPNTGSLPAPATKAGGMRLPAHYKGNKGQEDDTVTPKTNLEGALSNQSQQDLEKALGLPEENPTMSVADAAEHPKVNASTYTPDQGKHANQQHNHRSNAAGARGNVPIQQPGGAYGQQRH